MPVFLETINGRYAGTTFAVGAGEVCLVGSRRGADIFLPNDEFLAPLHFVVVDKENVWKIKNLADALFVNNKPVKENELEHGDYIFAGNSLFQFTVAGQKSSNDTVLGKLLAKLSNKSSVYCLIDEYTDRRILPILETANARFCHLKAGVENLEGLTANPLLVEILANNDLLETLIRTFWGAGRLVFFEPRYDFDETAKNLRILLSQTQIENGVDLRFYDPRMLRAVLGEAEKRHAQNFYSAARTYMVESQLPSHYFEFEWTNKRVNSTLHRLSNEDLKIPTQRQIADFLTVENLREDFSTTADICLKHLFQDPKTDFQRAAIETLPAIEKYAVQSLPAKIQFIALNGIFGTDFGESAEIENHFNLSEYSSDEKLEFLIASLNRTRF